MFFQRPFKRNLINKTKQTSEVVTLEDVVVKDRSIAVAILSVTRGFRHRKVFMFVPFLYRPKSKTTILRHRKFDAQIKVHHIHLSGDLMKKVRLCVEQTFFGFSECK